MGKLVIINNDPKISAIVIKFGPGKIVQANAFSMKPIIQHNIENKIPFALLIFI